VGEPADEFVRGLVTAGKLDGEHSTEPAHLAGRQRMLRMAREARVVHASHR
jgi:hypothetical protein